jgi:hypothetical protein
MNRQLPLPVQPSLRIGMMPTPIGRKRSGPHKCLGRLLLTPLSRPGARLKLHIASGAGEASQIRQGHPATVSEEVEDAGGNEGTGGKESRSRILWVGFLAVGGASVERQTSTPA